MTDNGSGEPSNPVAAASSASGPANAPASGPTGGDGGGAPAAAPQKRPHRGGGGHGAGPSSAQVAKLRDANAKYKNLLKLAKERIQAQEEELEKMRSESRRVREDLAAEKMRNAEMATERARLMMMASSSPSNGGGGAGGGMQKEETDGGGVVSAVDDENCQPVRVYQRIKVEDDEEDDNDDAEHDPIGEPDDEDSSSSSNCVIWALVGYEISPSDDVPVTSSQYRTRRFAEWRKFRAEADLSDHVRRDTGEPVSVPPYSLSPDQSARIESDARRSVERVTEEFRRFRVRAEVARKQADATVRALHSSNVATTRRRIEGQDIEAALEQARTDANQLSQVRGEMAEQEVKWKEAYDTLLAENNSLKSSGAEALLAAQWRHRYETCMSEKEDAEARLDVEREKTNVLSDARKANDAGKYEAKYRDLKESFRLYRKKAKEIFEAQQRGGSGVDAGLLHMASSDRGADDAKLSYLRNLMVNYLSSDSAVREHMETAIGTVLKFSDDDRSKIDKAKSDNESWF